MTEHILFVLGFILQISVVMASITKARGEVIWPLAYAKERPHKTIGLVVAPIAVYILVLEWSAGQPHWQVLLAAFASGYAPTLIIDSVTSFITKGLVKPK